MRRGLHLVAYSAEGSADAVLLAEPGRPWQLDQDQGYAQTLGIGSEDHDK